jgi:hypothetical protein
VNDSHTPDAPGFTVGVDELDERGTDYPMVALETAKARHLAAAMDRLDQAVTGAGPALRAWATRDAGTTAIGFTWAPLALFLLAGGVMSWAGVR